MIDAAYSQPVSLLPEDGFTYSMLSHILREQWIEWRRLARARYARSLRKNARRKLRNRHRRGLSATDRRYARFLRNQAD